MNGWPIHYLVDATNLITCGVAKRPNYVDSGIPFLSAKNVKNGRIIWSNYKYITQEDHEELTKNNKPLRGDILYTRVGSFGEAAIVDSDEEFSVFVSLTLIKPKHDILHNNYLKYYLNSSEVKQLAKSSISGSGVGNLNVGTVRKFPIPLPPIPEQKRIVAILDQVFADIEQARAKTEQNLKNARELFESYLQQVFSQRGEGWLTKSLDELGQITSSKRVFKKEYVESGVPFYRTKEVKQLANSESISTELFISNERYAEIKEKNGVPVPGDILLTAIGTIGEIFVVSDHNPFYFKDGNVLWLRAFDLLNSYFLKYALMAFVSELQRLSNGSAYNALPIQQLKKYIISFPDMKKQEEVVCQLDGLRQESRKLTTLYTQKLAGLDNLEQSILQKSFTGELTNNESKGAAA